MQNAACSKDEAAAPGKMPEVSFLTVQPKEITLFAELPGRVSAYQVAEVRPQVGGIIKERLFEEGSDVEAGQVLYRIDDALYQAAFKNAKAALAQEEANLVSAKLLAERYGKIVKTNAVSKQEYDEALAAYNHLKARVAAAQEALNTAAINLGYTEVVSPVSGRIGRSFITVGALATQNQPDPLATVQQLDRVYVDVTQSNTELLRLRRALDAGKLRSDGSAFASVRLLLEDGTPYVLDPLALSGEEPAEKDWLEGELLFSDVTIDQSTGRVTLRALFNNPRTTLLPGMYVKAVLREGVRDDAILVPQKAVQRDTRGRAYVYMLTKEEPVNPDDIVEELAVDGYYVAMRHIKIDRSYENTWLLSSGLEPGDRILVEGLQKVHPGQVVTGIEKGAQAHAAARQQAR